MRHWIEVTIHTEPGQVDALCARLSALGFDSLRVEDGDMGLAEQNRELVEPALLAQMQTRYRVSLYLPDETRLSILREALAPEERMFVQSVAEEMWAENWKRFYRPCSIGRRLLIQPAWLPVDNPEGRAVFLNNPGMSFGTGEHETTRLCLRALDRLVKSGDQVLDIGCGSGILFICALLLGAENAVAVELDPFASEIAKQNAEANGLRGRCRVLAGDALSEDPVAAGARYELIVSNIVADAVMALIPLVRRHLAPGGVWISSGVIDTRRDEVAAAARAAGFVLSRETEECGWICFEHGIV